MDTLTVEAIYKNGLIKPVEPIPLGENERIRIRIERSPGDIHEKARNVVRLRGIWKDHLTAAEREGVWVSDTISAIRHESGQRIERLAREIDEAFSSA